MFDTTSYLGESFDSSALAQQAEAAGCSPADAQIAAAIALAESGGNPNARALTPKEDSRGFWQINTFAHQGYGNLYDPSTNASAMYAISNGCTNWRPWTTFTSGKYLQFLNPDPSAGDGSSAGSIDMSGVTDFLSSGAGLLVAGLLLFFLLRR